MGSESNKAFYNAGTVCYKGKMVLRKESIRVKKRLDRLKI